MKRWLAVAVAAIALLLAAIALYVRFVGNPRVMDEIHAHPDGERAAKVMVITFPDGKRIPVNYLREGDTVYAGADGPWWRYFRDGGVDVTLEIRGELLQGHGVVVLDDPARKRDVFARLRPTVPKWLPEWLDAYLVVVTLDEPDEEPGG